MISLLVPTRQRPGQLKRFYDSAMDLANKPGKVEVVVYIDDDDDSYDSLDWFNLKKVRGGRIVLSQMWNKCWENSRGDIYGHMGDDIIFRTQDWDTIVTERIDAHPDKIAFVFGNDGSPGGISGEFGTHGFVHHMWTDILGRFVPPYFVSDYNDTWFNDVAKALGRHYCIPIETEHMHYTLGKAEIDQNTKDRLERHEKEDPKALYYSQEITAERENDIQKLKNYINAFAQT